MITDKRVMLAERFIVPVSMMPLSKVTDLTFERSTRPALSECWRDFGGGADHRTGHVTLLVSPPLIDLLTHSTAADGTDTPGELVEAADPAGVDMLAITDHDTPDG